MEIVILASIVLLFWTSEVLFGKPIQLFQEEPKKSKTEKLADALVDYLESLGKTSSK